MTLPSLARYPFCCNCNDIPVSHVTEPDIPDTDGLYAELIGVHEGLDDEASAAFNARLILILANHIGDRAVLAEALAAAALHDGDNNPGSEDTP